MANEEEKPGDALDGRCGGFFAKGGETHVGHWESCTLGSGWLRSGVRPLIVISMTLHPTEAQSEFGKNALI